MGTMMFPMLLLTMLLRQSESISPAAVSGGLDMADKAIDVVDKGVDVLTKIDNVLTGKLNAHYQAVEKRPESLIKPGDLAAIAANMKGNAKISFQNLPGFDGIEEYEPPGWQYEVANNEEPDQPDGEEEPNVGYPLGIGNVMMSGCFGGNYQPGDPCYEEIRFLDRCDNQIDSANFIGVGFDITQSYTSESRKRSVIQRNCANKATFLGKDCPDNMNAYGIYDYSVKQRSFQSAEKYREYLAKKSGAEMSSGIFQQAKSENQKTVSAGSSGWFHDVGVAKGWGGASSQTSGIKSSQSMDNQMANEGSGSSDSFIAVLEADMKLYEIALDHSSPDDLSIIFVKDFMNLPVSYFLIGADIKLQDFVLRYGTHYVKSAKFGGQLSIFKSSTSSSTMNQEQFAASAEREFSSMMSTLKSSFEQSSVKANFFGTGFQYGSNSRSAAATENEASAAAKTSKNAGTQKQANTEFIRTTVNAMGGDPEIAAAIMDFYTPAFKERFVKWLSTIPEYPKPYDMTFGRITDLFNLNVESLFKEGAPNAGCFGNLTTDKSGRKYFLQVKISQDRYNNTVTSTEKVFCKFGKSREKFMEEFKAKRLALERAISYYMTEGRFSTSSFELEGGEHGCETETLDYLKSVGRQSHSWPRWDDMTKTVFKIIFKLPFDIPFLKRDEEFEMMYEDGLWFAKIPGNRFTLDNTCPSAKGLPIRYRICVMGLQLFYNENHGYFKFDRDYYKNEMSYVGNITRRLGDIFIARAEAGNILKSLEENKLGEVPCNVKWSNSRRLDPNDETNCIHFSAASLGDIFVIFASIPKDHKGWYYLQMSPHGVAFYRGMKLEKIDNIRTSGTLGDKALFETFFVCVSQGKKRDVTLLYGKAPAQTEIGFVKATFSFPQSFGDRVSFYTFGSGQEKVIIDDLRVIKAPPKDLDCAEDMVKINGQCALDCDEQCDGCRQGNDPKSCSACKNVKHFYSDEKFVCQTECPAGTYLRHDKLCVPCEPGYYKKEAGNNKCLKCPLGRVSPKGSKTCTAACTKGTYFNGNGCLKCKEGTIAAKDEMTSCDKCPLGYTSNSERTACQDANECSNNKGGCSQMCENTQGSFKCYCNEGYVLSDDKRNCQDVNECSKNKGGCSHTCENTPGSFKCNCNDGFKLSDDKRSCTDVNECSKNKGGCSYMCENTPGSFKCKCKDGSELRDDKQSCAEFLIKSATDIKNANLVAMVTMEKEYTVTFEVFVTSFDDILRNVIHFSAMGGDNGGYGDRTPAVWFKGMKICITSAVSGNKNFETCSKEPVRAYKWIPVVIKQTRDGSGKYWYTNQVGDQKVFRIVNTSPRRFKNVKVYVADPWQATKFGKIRNLSVLSEDLNECSKNNGGCSHTCENTPGSFTCSCNDGFKLMDDKRSCKEFLIKSATDIKHGNLLTTVTMEKEYTVTFEVFVNSFDGTNRNIIHFSAMGGNNWNYGDRIPAVWIKGNKICITSAVSGNKNFETCSKVGMLKWIPVVIKQTRDWSGKYWYTNQVDDQKVFRIVNTDPRRFKYVKVYVADPWSSYLWGKIRNLYVESVESSGLRCAGQDNGCCTTDEPCQEGEGDCDEDQHCSGSLKCGVDNCPWGAGDDDCCYKHPEE